MLRASKLDEQNLLMVKPETESGCPAYNEEDLAIFPACSPCWVTQPNITSSSKSSSRISLLTKSS